MVLVGYKLGGGPLRAPAAADAWTPEQQRALAAGFEGAGIETEYVELDCIRGHDSFLVDYDRFCPAVRHYFNRIL